MKGAALTLRIQAAIPPAEVDRIFNVFGEDLRDWTAPMVRIRVVLARMFEEIFSSSGGALSGTVPVRGGAVPGGTWTDTADTLRRKIRAGQRSEPLRATGALERTFTNADGGPNTIRRVSASRDGIPKLTYGTTLSYAPPLHFGSTKRGMPARPIVGMTEAGREGILEELQRHLSERLQAVADAINAGGRT